MKLPKFFTNTGWFASFWATVFSLGGLLLALFPWFFDIGIGYCLILTCIGSVISLIGSYEAKAKQFGFQAPFTNDPLGWRKAKESYKAETQDKQEGADKQ